MSKRHPLGAADLRVLRKVVAGHPLIYTEVEKPRGGTARAYEMAGENQAKARAEALSTAKLIRWTVIDGIGRAEATAAGRREVEREAS